MHTDKTDQSLSNREDRRRDPSTSCLYLCESGFHLWQIDGLGEIPSADRDAVLAAYPRINFKQGIVQAFADGFAYKPATTFGTINSDVLERTLPGYRRPNFCELIAANPLGG
jgi:hypothetical protein